MYVRKRYRYPHKACKAVHVILWATLLVVLPSILKTPADRVDQFSKGLGWLVRSIQDQAWWLVTILGVLSLLSSHACKWFQARYMNTAVWHLLQQVHRFAFQDIQRDPVYQHRVTLFRATWCLSWANRSAAFWPFGRKLVIAVRSGHMTQNSKTTWSIGDNPGHCHGFAGKVWLHKQVVCIANLPKISGNANNAALRKYARNTNVTEEWLKNKEPKPTATSFLGIPVEVKNELWGVVVLDSSNPKGIRFNTSANYQDAYDYVGVSIGKMLERSL